MFVDVKLSVRPLGLVLTVIGVVISRALDFSPGFLIGLVLGAIGSYVLGLVLRPSLGEMIAQNYTILVATSIMIFVVAFLATLFPARRATTADPIAALRAE